tara:strand:- start:1024 stop:1740 length:717 start_codon:yes stop_codon:yes gene_type:complete
MDIIILLTIIITSFIQSIFGTGVLLFGTPILLLFGYDFQNLLIVLLPTSILINLFQLKGNSENISFKFYKKLFIYSVPFIILLLYIVTTSQIKIDLFVGLLIIFICLKEHISFINKSVKYIIKYENLYLIIMGIIHGITNLGGALLSTIIFSKKMTKIQMRSTIAICYLTFAVFQILTLISLMNYNHLTIIVNFYYWITGLIIFFIVETYLYPKINEEKYSQLFRLFLFCIGLLLIIK